MVKNQYSISSQENPFYKLWIFPTYVNVLEVST